MTPVPVSLALLAALLFALSAVAQQRAAAGAPAGAALLGALVRSPVWLAGTAAGGLGFVALVGARASGPLLLVQPLLATTLLFALPLAARLRGRPVTRTDLTRAATLTVALAVFVVSGRPASGEVPATSGSWAPALAGAVVVVLACVATAARRPPGTARAVLLAAAAAVSFALGAVLLAGVVEALGRGPLAALTAWPTWAVLAAVLGGSWLQQAAYQAGDLAASLPVVTAGEQGVAAVLGVVVLGERVAPGPVAVLAFLVVLVAAAALARAAEPAREHLRH
ncbi:MAG: DMT family transporter [Pseudonocardia sediminis]